MSERTLIPSGCGVGRGVLPLRQEKGWPLLSHAPAVPARACVCVQAVGQSEDKSKDGSEQRKTPTRTRERASFSHPVWSERCFDVDLDRARSSLLLLALLSPRRTVHLSSVTVNLGHLWDDGEAINAAFTAALTAPPPPLSLPAAWRSAFASYRVAAAKHTGPAPGSRRAALASCRAEHLPSLRGGERRHGQPP